MNNDLSKRIMGRVYAIYVLQRIFSFATLKIVLALFAIYELSAAVSWSNVLANMPSLTDVKALYAFSSVAVTNTQLAVQLSIAILLVLTFNLFLRLLKKENARSALAA